MTTINKQDLMANVNAYLVEKHKIQVAYYKEQKKSLKDCAMKRMKTALILHHAELLSEDEVVRWTKYGHIIGWDGEIKNTPSDTKRKLKALFGQCSEDIESKCEDGNSKTTIRIPYCMGDKYHGPVFYRVHVLQPGDACQYKTTVETYTSTSLVCNIAKQ